TLAAPGSGGCLSVQGTAGERDHGLSEQLAHRGVGLDEGSDLVDRRLPVEGQVTLTQLFGYPRAHHVDPEDASTGAVGALLGNDLDQAFGLTDDHRSPVAGVSVLRRDHVVARRFG